MSDINNITGSYKQKAYTEKTIDKGRVDNLQDSLKKKSMSETGADKVSLSETSKDLLLAGKTAQEALDGESENRAEKIEQIKKSVQNGEYKVSADDIADKLIKSVFDIYI